MVINTDTHNVDQLHLMNFETSQARRGWAEKPDIINAWPVVELLRILA
jgi:DNA polymerase (family 10)